jgi:hypothetical protein
MLSDNDLWKNDEIMAVNAEVGLTFDVLAKLCRAIEAAVLEAQEKQEPVAWVYTVNNSHSVFSAEKPPEDAYDEGTLYPLYAAPVVQPGMAMVPMETFDRLSSTGEECEFNDMASMCFPLDEWSDFEAMIATAGDKL